MLLDRRARETIGSAASQLDGYEVRGNMRDIKAALITAIQTRPPHRTAGPAAPGRRAPGWLRTDDS